MGRTSLRLCRTARRRGRDGRRDHPIRQGEARQVQAAAHHRLFRSAQDLDRQDPEIPVARTGQGAVSSRYALAFIFLTMLIDTIGLGVIIPVSPRLIAGLTHEPISGAARWGGWLFFSYALMQFLCAPLIGNLSDRFGRRPVLILSLAMLGVDYLITGLAPTIAWLFIGRTLSGMAGAAYPIGGAGHA